MNRWRAEFRLWGAHAPRVLTPVRLGLLAPSPKQSSLLPTAQKVRDREAQSPAREGACAPQTQNIRLRNRQAGFFSYRRGIFQVNESPEEQAAAVRLVYELDAERKLSGRELSGLAERFVNEQDPVEASRIRETIVRGFYGAGIQSSFSELLLGQPPVAAR
jgi:hypothetical protein